MILDQIPKKSGYNVFVDGVKQHTDIFLYSVIIEGVVYYTYKTKKPIVMPVISGDTFTYNGEAQGPTLTNLDGERYYTITGATATAAGTYTLTVSLDNPDRTEWSDGTTADLTFSYTINPAHVMPPTVTNDGVYYSTDGTPKGPTVVDSVDVDKYTVTGGSASVAGNYTMTVAINDKDNYIWEDTATTTDKTYAYEVKNVLLVAPPTVTVGTYTYSGSAQGPTVINSSDSDKYTITGATQTNAGSYTLTVSLNDPTICRWSDTTDAVDKTYSYTIAKKKVTPPTVSNTSKTYSGSAQSPTVTNSADSTWYTVTNTAQTNAGSYSVTAALKAGTGGANVVWSDNTSANKSFAWSIAKKKVIPPTITVGSYTYSGSAQGPSLTNSADSGWYTVSNRTNTNAGSYICTVSLNAGTGGSNVVWNDTNAAANKTYNYTINKADTPKPGITKITLGTYIGAVYPGGAWTATKGYQESTSNFTNTTTKTSNTKYNTWVYIYLDKSKVDMSTMTDADMPTYTGTSGYSVMNWYYRSENAVPINSKRTSRSVGTTVSIGFTITIPALSSNYKAKAYTYSISIYTAFNS